MKPRPVTSPPAPTGRRSFLKNTTLAAGTLALPWTARSWARVRGANERLRVGIVGCGNITTARHVPQLIQIRDEANVDLAALCDVWPLRAIHCQNIAREAGTELDVVGHYTDLLARDDLDIVVVATPEHSHAYITLDALDAGKHVYVEKPLAHTIREAQAIVDKVAETGLLLQVGIQSLADDSYVAANAAIRAGLLGPVIHAQTDYVRHYAGEAGLWRANAKDIAVQPEGLDWIEWLKPNRPRPWDAERYMAWRCYRDYSGGIATDLFIHRLTRILVACDLTYPDRVVGLGGIYLWDDERTLPDNLDLLAEYPAVEGITPGMNVHILGTMGNKHGLEHCIRGHEGTLIFTPTGWEIRSQPEGEVVATHEKTGEERVYLHHLNLCAAIRGEARLHCPAELGLYGVVATTMANESWFRRRMMRWSPKRRHMYPDGERRMRFSPGYQG